MIPLNFPINDSILTATKAEKYWIHTEEHGPLLETLCGNTAFVFGFDNEYIIQKVSQQQKKLSYLVHTNYTSAENNTLIEKLCKLGNFHSVSYAISGSDGVECAVALSDYYWRLTSPEKTMIISFSPGYHGITYLARALRGSHSLENKIITVDAPRWHAVSQRSQLERIAFNKLTALFETNKHIGAVIMEAVPWIDGLRPWSEQWWKDIRDLCTRNNVHLIIDDVMGGLGKLGHVFSHVKYNIQPDIAVLGKALTGGYSPLSCACASQTIANKVKDTWEYGHTWQPNMMGVAAALAAIELFDEKTVPEIQKLLTVTFYKLQYAGLISHFTVCGLMSQIFFQNQLVSPKQMHQNGLTCNWQGETFNSLIMCAPLIADQDYFTELEKRLRALLG